MANINPLDPQQIAPGSFAAKLAARKARKEGKSITEEVDVSTLSEEERAQLVRTDAIKEAERKFQFVPANSAPEHITIFFDDSSSMYGQKIEDAREGTTEFMRECVPNETAVSIIPLNASSLEYTCNLPQLALRVKDIVSSGGTPLYERMTEHMSSGGEVKPTRLIVFSDGEPRGGMRYAYNAEDNSYGQREFSEMHHQTIKQAIERGLPIDTCLIADANYEKTSPEYLIMKDLADKTGGIFIVFEKGKCSLRHGLKFLTKGNRLLLMDGSFKAALEEGRV